MLDLAVDGLGRAFFAVCFYLFLQHFGMIGGGEMGTIGTTVVFTHIMIGLTGPNTGFVKGIIPVR